MLHPLDGSAFELMKAAYLWLAEPDQWGACLGWNLGTAGLLSYSEAWRYQPGSE